ncbi:unnamed protein product [Cylindrotheca closterium]|uniref:Uncharacterized protein n=1 Tax=Cylindrotheca closterium TaxID=2856 RepID=A0AAD2PTY8_9STRA|nr:unnamed protein product [Cylindrotheca closterium]
MAYRSRECIRIVWDSREGKWRFRRTHQLLPDHPLQIPGLTGKLEALRRLEPDEAEKTLGVMLAPLEDQHAHVAHLKSIAKKWAEQVRLGHLHKYDVIPLIKTTVMKSLEYPMVLTTLDAATWVSIMSPVLQVSKHLEVRLCHLSNRTKTGAYMEAAVQEHQLETGTSFGLFQQDYSNTAILASDTWLKRVWKELEDLDIYVALDSPVLPLRCKGDALLIEVFMELEVDQDALKWLNWCRMFLQVCTVSDIVTANGRSIRESMWHGERDYAHRNTTLLVSDGPQRLLRHPLGPWIDPLDNWNWLWSSTHGLFHRQGHGWQHYRDRRSSTQSIQWDLSRSTQLSRCKQPHNEHTDNGVSFLPAPFWTQPLPADLCRATVHITPLLGTLALTSIGTAPLQPHHDSQPSLLAAWMAASARVTEYVGWTPEEIEIDGNESLLAAALLEDRLCVISDGSYKLGLGMAVVQLLPCKGGTERIIVRCQTPGLTGDQSAYRSELIGLLAGIMVVDWLLDQWAPTLRPPPRVRIACDGFSALLNTFGDNRVTPQQAQFDLVSSIREALARSRASREPSHVYGHLDTATSFSCLSWWSKRNVEVDAWAVAYRHQIEASHRLIAPNARFFTELAARSNGVRLTGGAIRPDISFWYLIDFKWNPQLEDFGVPNGAHNLLSTGVGPDTVPSAMGGTAKAGICRNFPRAMVYTPIALQGVGVPHWYGLQVIKHLDMLLRHPANQTKTGAFVEAVLQTHQLETGTSCGLFQQVYSNTSILVSDTWAKRTWRELDSLSIHLEFDSPSLQPLHQGNQLLVDLFIDSLVDQLTLKWLNWCRIFLHAVTLSNIVNAEGTAITLNAWKGIRADYRADRYQWPCTARPSNQW